MLSVFEIAKRVLEFLCFGMKFMLSVFEFCMRMFHVPLALFEFAVRMVDLFVSTLEIFPVVIG